MRRRLVVALLAIVLLGGATLTVAPTVSAHAAWEHPVNRFNHYIGDQTQADQFCNAVLLWTIDSYPYELVQDADGRTVDPRSVWWAWGNLREQRCYWNQ